MDTFHTPTRGWLSGRLKGRQWLLLGMFLLFYVGLMSDPVKEIIQDSDVRIKSTCKAEANLSQVNPPKQKDGFLGLPY